MLDIGHFSLFLPLFLSLLFLSYSGPTAAYGYNQIDPNTKRFVFLLLSFLHSLKFLCLFVYSSRIFVLGPSHHVYIERMNITGANILQTPLGNLIVDTNIRTTLLSTGLFDIMPPDVDCDEHSLEMQVFFS